MRKRIAIYILTGTNFLVASPQSLWGLESLDLTQAIGYALKQNRELVRTALSVDRNDLGVEGAAIGENERSGLEVQDGGVVIDLVVGLTKIP